MGKQLVYHHNCIGHEINESLEYYLNDIFDREIYCRKLHRVTEPTEKDCLTCPHCAGWMQGYGHECAWEDWTDSEHVVQHENRYKEYERVDRLIKMGKLSNINYELITKVQNLPYDEQEWIYEQSVDRTSRYLLGKKGQKTLICCGVNPSTASPGDLDPTMKKVEKICELNGYDSYLMINLYPMRATKPKDMHPEDEMDANIIEKNLDYIEEVLKKGQCDIWAAWGVSIEERKYLKESLKKIANISDKYQCSWYTFGETTKEGHPRHPLFLRAESNKEIFDVHKYLQELK